MKLKKGLVLRDVCGEKVIVAEGLDNVNFGKMIMLNETAAYLFENVGGSDFTLADLARLLLEKYDVAQDVVERDVAILCKGWADAGILE